MRLHFPALLRNLCLLTVLAVLVTMATRPLQAVKFPKLKKSSQVMSEQTFVGKIKSIDFKKRVMMLTTTEGNQEETFDYKKNVRITSAHKAGELKVKELKPGMLVTLYIKNEKSSSVVYEVLIM